MDREKSPDRQKSCIASGSSIIDINVHGVTDNSTADKARTSGINIEKVNTVNIINGNNPQSQEHQQGSINRRPEEGSSGFPEITDVPAEEVSIGDQVDCDGSEEEDNSRSKQGPSEEVSPGLPENRAADTSVTPSEEALQVVAKVVGRSWQKLGRKLGLSNGEIETVQLDYTVMGQEEVVYQMLRKWLESATSPPASLRLLKRACVDVGRKDIADKL